MPCLHCRICGYRQCEKGLTCCNGAGYEIVVVKKNGRTLEALAQDIVRRITYGERLSNPHVSDLIAKLTHQSD